MPKVVLTLLSGEEVTIQAKSLEVIHGILGVSMDVPADAIVQGREAGERLPFIGPRIIGETAVDEAAAEKFLSDAQLAGVAGIANNVAQLAKAFLPKPPRDICCIVFRKRNVVADGGSAVEHVASLAYHCDGPGSGHAIDKREGTGPTQLAALAQLLAGLLHDQ